MIQAAPIVADAPINAAMMVESMIAHNLVLIAQRPLSVLPLNR